MSSPRRRAPYSTPRPLVPPDTSARSARHRKTNAPKPLISGLLCMMWVLRGESLEVGVRSLLSHEHGYVGEARIRRFYGPEDDKVVFWKHLTV
jgi:hypothetical protein